MSLTIEPPALDVDDLRQAIQDEYALVANEPEHGFHFKAAIDEEWLAALATLSSDVRTN